MTTLRLLPLVLIVGCNNYWSERHDKAAAIASNTSTSDAAALTGVANTCFAVASAKGKKQVRAGKLESGGYSLSVVTMGLALTQSRTLDHAKKNMQNAIGRDVQCALSAARARRLEHVTVSYVLPVQGGSQELYRIKATLTALDTLEGWEALDASDFDEMQKLWGTFEVLKEDFADIEVR